MLNKFNIPGIDTFSSLFSSETEMFFYIFCFIAFHMLMIRLFYSHRRARGGFKFQLRRGIIIIMAVAEIGIFGALLSRDNIHNSLDATTQNMFQKVHVRPY